MLAASAKQIRDEFEGHRNVGAGEELDKLVTKAREAVEFMKVNIVQAKLNERGNYGALLLTFGSSLGLGFCVCALESA